MDMQSLYNFRFTNRFFWTFLRQPHRKSFRRTLAPWANTALFLVDQKAMKLPPFLERTCPNLAPDNRPRNIYEAANIFRDVKPFSVSVPHYTGVPTLKLLSPLLRKQYYPPDKDWVLRNHVTKEYVQAKGLTEAKPSEHEWPDVYFHMPDDVDSDYDEQDSDYVYDGDNWVENSDEEAEQVRKQEEREVSLAKTPERVLKLIEDLIDRREIIQHGKPGSGRVDAMHPLGFGLGHVLALKILWSGGAHLVRRRLMIHGCYLPGAAMGPWAGHTFDVVTNETLTAELGRDPDDGTKVSDQEDLEWRDITASVRTDLLMMYLVNDWDVMPPPRDVAKAAGGRKKFGKLLELLKERRRRAAV
ncbi:hypothetical protein BDZ91DRAFT_754779 [Kalaharituber pfeilii]|nr:hypothetical protein BDZ91DRAFT_754779 [Kalaharituber pfeilii]